ncbi:MAG: hypothetical protein H7Z74_13070 [Anaerolineae bacterium]|nr:hypothetical protein [Gemmatimonadaceae bacterium]
MNETAAVRYRKYFDTAEIPAGESKKVAAALGRALHNRARYESVARLIGVPWVLLAALHEREATGNMSRHPANGDKLDRRTVHVPKGLPKRIDPPFTYENCAEEEYAELRKPKDGIWTEEWLAWSAEHFNGMGYAMANRPSPYLVASTTLEESGKYTSDGHFDESHLDGQVGCIALWIAMRAAGISVP